MRMKMASKKSVGWRKSILAKRKRRLLGVRDDHFDRLNKSYHRLIFRRYALGMTRTDLANHAKVETIHIALLEQGLALPLPGTVRKIFAGLGIEWNEVTLDSFLRDIVTESEWERVKDKINTLAGVHSTTVEHVAGDRAEGDRIEIVTRREAKPDA